MSDPIALRNAKVESLLHLIRPVYLRLRREKRLPRMSPEEVLSHGAEGLLRAVELWRDDAGGITLEQFGCRGIRNSLFHACRQEQRQRRGVSTFSDFEPVTLDPESLPDPKGSGRNVAEVLEVLPAEQRQLVRRILLEGETQREVSQDLALSASSVSRMLREALTTLRMRLEQTVCSNGNGNACGHDGGERKPAPPRASQEALAGKTLIDANPSHQPPLS